MIGNITCHNGTRSDKGACPYPMSAYDCRIGSDRCPVANRGSLICRRSLRISGARRQIVRKHTGGTAEDTIPDLYAFVNADVVLNLHVIAYMHIICDVDILSQTAIIANGRACLYVTKMPDLVLAPI